MIYSWRGKQSTTAKKEENTQITQFKNNSEEIRVNGKKSFFFRLIRLQAFGEGLLSVPMSFWHRQQKEDPLRIWDADGLDLYFIRNVQISSSQELICEGAQP